MSREQIRTQRKHIREFIDDLDEQYKEGLLMEESYTALKNKNQRELRELEIKESLLDDDAAKK